MARWALFLLATGCTVSMPQVEKEDENRLLEILPDSMVIIIPPDVWRNPDLMEMADLYDVFPDPKPFPESR